MWKVKIDQELSYASFELDNYTGEFDTSGDVLIETHCSCGANVGIMLNYQRLRKLARQAENFMKFKQERTKP